MSSTSGFDELLARFGRFVRDAGITVGTDDVLTFATATELLGITDVMDVYWAGRATMVRRREQIPAYNAAFRAFFLAETPEAQANRKRLLKASSTAGATLEVPNTEEGLPGEASQDEAKLGLLASTSEVYRHKAFAECSDDEMRAVRRVLAALRVSPPLRRTFRRERAKRSPSLDMRAMARESMRALGEPQAPRYRRRKTKLRPVVLILDVSGSMADYSRNLLQFAYSARRANAKVEVYCFGTRLTRITKSLDRRDADTAMRLAGESVLDWDGGTRIGDSLLQFCRQARRTRLGRGAIVIVCSDGLDRGDPQDMADAMEHLSRLAHRVLWVNPLKGDSPEYVPSTMAMTIAAPFIDEVHSGHNLASLEAFAARLAKVG